MPVHSYYYFSQVLISSHLPSDVPVSPRNFGCASPPRRHSRPSCPFLVECLSGVTAANCPVMALAFTGLCLTNSQQRLHGITSQQEDAAIQPQLSIHKASPISFFFSFLATVKSLVFKIKNPLYLLCLSTQASFHSKATMSSAELRHLFCPCPFHRSNYITLQV